MHQGKKIAATADAVTALNLESPSVGFEPTTN